MTQLGYQGIHVQARKRFSAHFGRPAVAAASAPGRVNLLGEHTDYNGGFVLPTAIPQRTVAAIAPRSDRRVVVCSRALADERNYLLGHEQRGAGWLDYVQGVSAAAVQAGFTLGGFDAYVESTIPLGAGLSSSAALAVSLLLALREAFGWNASDVELARIAVRGENDLVGVPVGVMDPMACVLANPGSALFLDTRNLEYRTLRLPEQAALVVIDSGERHALAGGEYRARRQECAAAAAALTVHELRDVEEADPRIAALPAPLDRRARHVVSENARVLRAVAALERGDASELGTLFDASHASQRDDFEVSTPGIDALVERARALPGVLGARLTGGGFGGSVVCLVRAGNEHEIAAALTGGGTRALLPIDGGRT